MRRVRRKIGTYLRKLREERDLSLNEVIAELSLKKIKCSRSHLSRIELEDNSFRIEILAGLGLVYDVSVDDILYYSR